MSLYRRKGSRYYWASFLINGKRIQKSLGTEDRKVALQLHAELENKYRQGIPDKIRKIRWLDVSKEWLETKQTSKTYYQYASRIPVLDSILGHLNLADIDKVVITRLIKKLSINRSSGTVNNFLATLSGVLKYAQEHDYIETLPRIPMGASSPLRIRWLSRQEFEHLARVLPPHLSEMARLAVTTGLRKGNILALRWSQVDLPNKTLHISGSEVKTKTPLTIPLNAEAMGVIERQRGQHPTYVFTYRGKPLTSICHETWAKHCRAAGIENFHWHDLRHTWASWHKQAGTDSFDLQMLGGWKSPAMLMRYAHLSNARKQAIAERIVSNVLHGQEKDE